MRRSLPSPVDLLFWFLLFIYSGFVFTLPLFPSTDGPVHVYYADILADRLFGGEDYVEFTIRQYLPPYALANYYLALAGRLLPGELAEESLVCICVLLLCLGFRALVRALAGGESAAVLLIFPFAFHWFLFTGFYSFCLGLGLAFVTIAWWIRESERSGGRTGVVFLALVVGLYLAHPLPLAIALMFAGISLALSILFTPVSTSGGMFASIYSSLEIHRFRILMLALAALPALWVTTYVAGNSTPNLAVSWSKLWWEATVLWRMTTIMPHTSEPGRFVRLAVIGIGLLLGLSGLVGRQGNGRPRQRLLVCLFGVFLFFVFAWFPGMIGGATYVGERLAFTAVLALLAGTSAVKLPPKQSLALAISLAILSLVAFREDASMTSQAAEMNRVLLEAPAGAGGRGAIFLEGGWGRDEYPGTRYWPCRWAASHYFRRSRATMLNTPWLHLPFWMLGTREYRNYYGKEPPSMPEYMLKSLENPDADHELPGEVDFLIGADCAPGEPDYTKLERLSAHYGLERMPWSTREYVFYAKPGWATMSR